mmetsp:Transcript_34709/g.67178  ORF Transcript_34709/g.67178 Transcript_34709/m.67178 type:complete len:348 (-) Transcript_34709:188-1231(-)
MASGTEDASTHASPHNIAVAGLLLTLYFGMNVVFNIYNKWLFSGPLPTPVLVTMTHQAFCFLGASSAVACSPEWLYKRTELEGTVVWIKLMIIPFGFVLNIGLNNISLLFCTLALNQLIRSFAPVAVAIASYFIEGKSYSYPKQLTLGILVLGILLGVSASPDFELVGFLLCAASVVGATFQIVLTGYFVGGQKVTLHVFDIFLYTALPSIILLLPLAYTSGDHVEMYKAWEKLGTATIAVLLLSGGFIAFFYNIITILLIKFTSSVYYSVAGGFKVCLVIGFSFIVFDQKITRLSLLGIILACVAFAANSYLTFTEKQKDAEEQESLRGLLTGKSKDVEVAHDGAT